MRTMLRRAIRTGFQTKWLPTFLSLFLPALALESANVQVSSKDIELKFEAQDGVKIGRLGEVPPERSKNYFRAEVQSNPDWNEAKIVFTPQASGKLGVRLYGPATVGVSKTKYKPVGIYYDNIKVNGKLVQNGDFEAGGKGFAFYIDEKDYPGRVISNQALAASGNNCAVAWASGQMAFTIDVVNGEPVVLTFDHRECKEIPPLSEQNAFYPISLANVANMGFADEREGDGKGGWTDQGPANDFSPFSGGIKDFNGRPYVVVDPAQNGGKSCIVFKSNHTTAFGVQSITLPVDKVCYEISLLDTCAWGPKTADMDVACVTVNFAGKPAKTFPITFKENIAGWWNPINQPDAKVAWVGHNGMADVGLYSTILKLGETAKVDSITITVKDPNQDMAYCLVGLTAGLVLKDANDEIQKMSYTVKLDNKTNLAALPLDSVKLDMRKHDFPADKFFEGSLGKLALFDENGNPLEIATAEYARNLDPVILVKSPTAFSSVTMKLTGDAANRKKLSPRAAFQKISGKEGSIWQDDFGGKGIVLNPASSKLENFKVQPDEDSFYNTMVEFDGKTTPGMECEFELKEPKTMKIFVLVRSSLENDYNRCHVRFDGGEEIIVGGEHYKKYLAFYWNGGQKISLAQGKHTFKMAPGAKKLQLARFYLAEGDYTPVIPGFREEMLSLKNSGFEIYGLPKEECEFKHVASEDPIHRIVNAEKSFPDLTSLSDTNIDKDGTLHPDGVEMKFDSGRKAPFIWGCNISSGSLHELCDESRIGDKGFDVLMKRIKSMGYSSMRVFFGYSMPRAQWTNINNIKQYLLSTSPLEFHPEMLRNMQMLIAAAHRNGLYLNITFWTNQFYCADLGNDCMTGFTNPEAIRRQKQIIKMLLDTPNPYRDGIRPANDPTIAICEIENERNFAGNNGCDRENKNNCWKTLPADTKAKLYVLWHEFLKGKYQNFVKVKESWGNVPLAANNGKEEIDNIDFPPFWNIKEWGKDDSPFAVKMDDLRVTSASYGTEKKSNPAVSDSMEFLYNMYAGYLSEMYGYFRSLGFKGVITACGADTELYYIQRAGANKVLDAVSGGTSYWNRTGYGFLRSLSWLDPLVYAATPGKPMISREYGGNLSNENVWWGNVMSASIQKSMAKAYLFNFNLGIMEAEILPDYFYPNDSLEKLKIGLQHEAHIYDHFANLASAIAVRSDELQKPEFTVDIADPLDNVCYSAPFRGYNKTTINSFIPFLYTDSAVTTFLDKYNGKADLVVNEPATPTGDYSNAKEMFFIRPHSSFDRYGEDASAWLNGKTFSAEGFMAKREEQLKLYDAIVKAGGKMPVGRDEYCKVWRDSNRKLEIDTEKATFKADTSTFGSFIGQLDNANDKHPRYYSLEGSGDAWTFFGKTPAGDLLFAIMNGKVDLKDFSKNNYILLAGNNLSISNDGKPFVKLLGGETINVGLKTEGKSLTDASTIYATFFQSKSCQTPAELEFGRTIKEVYACNRDGARLATVPHSEKSFCNLWTHGNEISYYEVIFKSKVLGYEL